MKNKIVLLALAFSSTAAFAAPQAGTSVGRDENGNPCSIELSDVSEGRSQSPVTAGASVNYSDSAFTLQNPIMFTEPTLEFYKDLLTSSQGEPLNGSFEAVNLTLSSDIPISFEYRHVTRLGTFTISDSTKHCTDLLKQ